MGEWVLVIWLLRTDGTKAVQSLEPKYARIEDCKKAADEWMKREKRYYPDSRITVGCARITESK